MSISQIFRQSLYSPDFYRGLKDKPLSFSLRYFFSLGIAFSLALTILFVIEFGPMVNSLLREAAPFAERIFPEELEVRIEKGAATANVEQPYFIPLPENWRNTERTEENLLVIDTEAEFSVDRFREYKTWAWLTKNDLAFQDEGAVRLESLSRSPDVTINKNWVRDRIGEIKNISRWVIPLLVFLAILLIFLGFFLFFAFNLIYLFVGAVLVLLIARIKKITLTYRQAYQIGIHVLSWSLILQFVVFLGFPWVPFLFSLLFVSAAWLNLQTDPPVSEIHAA